GSSATPSPRAAPGGAPSRARATPSSPTWRGGAAPPDPRGPAAAPGRAPRRFAVEDPRNGEQHDMAGRAGLDVAGVPVDDAGIDVDALARTGADAVMLTPAHQHPTGVLLSAERRAALCAWLRERDAFA